jgi:hypothetical protein
MSKWEYKIINIRSENYRLDPNSVTQLNQLGEDGWELVSITSVNFKTGATDNIAMVFKRPAGGLPQPLTSQSLFHSQRGWRRTRGESGASVPRLVLYSVPELAAPGLASPLEGQGEAAGSGGEQEEQVLLLRRESHLGLESSAHL